MCIGSLFFDVEFGGKGHQAPSLKSLNKLRGTG